MKTVILSDDAHELVLKTLIKRRAKTKDNPSGYRKAQELDEAIAALSEAVELTEEDALSPLLVAAIDAWRDAILARIVVPDVKAKATDLGRILAELWEKGVKRP